MFSFTLLLPLTLTLSALPILLINALFSDPIYKTPVKNRFSNPTKEQEGRDLQGKDVTNDHQGKVLREGCCERKEARASVSSREKENTNRNLARVTTKSKSRMQTVSNGCVNRGERNQGFEECPNIGDLVK